MNVYVAAPGLAAGRPIAAQIRDAGHHLTSSWLAASALGTDQPDAALIDLDDISTSDVLVLVNDLERWSGRHVEAGYALACRIPVIVLGPASNVFYRTLCTVVATPAEAIVAISEVRA